MDAQQRKSHTSLGEIYFWTATVHKWLPLLEEDVSKNLVVNYLKKLFLRQGSWLTNRDKLIKILN